MDGGYSDISRPPRNNANKKIQQTQAQVNEVVGIMKENVEKVLERDHKLSELDSRADALQEGASQFQQQAVKLKKKMWWKNMKMMIIIGVFVALLVLLIVVWISTSVMGSDQESSSP